MRSWWLLALLVSGTAGAEPRRVAVDTPADKLERHPAALSGYLYLNRCTGGCSITGATSNDAAAGWSTIPGPGSYLVSEFADVTGATGTMAADADWAGIVQCMKEVYSPYGITVSDQLPPPGTPFNMAVIAGKPQNVGLGVDIVGISPFSNDCSAVDNVITFSFANHHGPDQRVTNICWTAAQESAHAYGLDHEFEFSDGTSACNDPMTYRIDCGGQKFFRNKRAKCGEMAARSCKCNSTQNSHQALLSIFGPAEPITKAPTASILAPMLNDAVQSKFVVQIAAGSQRGVARVELFINGSQWMKLPGAKFGLNGQPEPPQTGSTYPFYTPPTVPDGILDLEGKAYDDLGFGVATIPITVTKGAPCTSDDACADHQHCDEGRCRFDAPAGELGDSCDYGQYCKSWTCLGDGDKFCTQECLTDEPTSCPAGFECLASADTGTAGFCWVPDDGCCSVGHSRPRWFNVALALALVAWLSRRRR